MFSIYATSFSSGCYALRHHCISCSYWLGACHQCQTCTTCVFFPSRCPFSLAICCKCLSLACQLPIDGKVQVNSHQKSVGSTAADPWPMPPWRPWPPWRPCQADTAFKQNFEHRQERIWPKNWPNNKLLMMESRNKKHQDTWYTWSWKNPGENQCQSL